MRAILAFMLCFWTVSAAFAADYTPSLLQKDKVFPGTVLFTDVSDPRRPVIVEVDAEGHAVWQYNLAKSLVPKDRTPLPLGDATLLANGNILFTVHSKGIFEIDRSGSIIWKHRDREASHEVDRLPNGNTLYNRGWVRRGEDAVREVTPEGEVVWSWTGLPAFADKRYEDVSSEGWMHVNACHRMDDGTTLISIRNFHTVVRVDRRGEVVWSYRFRSKGKMNDLSTPDGKAKGSANHEPEMLENGNMLVAVRKPHAVLEIDPGTGAPVWIWKHPEGLVTIRDCNRLPNGNTLITGADKIVEVTSEGEIVWEIRAPKTRQDKPFHRAIKIGEDGTVYGN